MYDKKENNLKKRGLCVSLCAALVCGLGIGGVYYKMNKAQQDDGTKLFSDSSAGTKEKNVDVSKKASENNTKNNTVAAGSGAVKNIKSNKKKNTIKTAREKINDVKIQDKKKTDAKKEEIEKKNIQKTQNKKNDKTVNTMSKNDKLEFDAGNGMSWPVGSSEKDIILKFSDSNTIYFKTLAQYKTNPAIIISAKTDEQVKSVESGVVKSIKTSDETGTTVTVDIGSGYEVIYGQLKDLNVKNGQKIAKGDIIGHIAKPTKYYTVEGSNLYFEVRENGKSIDPLLLLK